MFAGVYIRVLCVLCLGKGGLLRTFQFTEDFTEGEVILNHLLFLPFLSSLSLISCAPVAPTDGVGEKQTEPSKFSREVGRK